jgi:hypothetical protein
MPLARIHEVFPLLGWHCGTAMQTIAFVTETASMPRILTHLDEATKPLVLSPAPGGAGSHQRAYEQAGGHPHPSEYLDAPP